MGTKYFRNEALRDCESACDRHVDLMETELESTAAEELNQRAMRYTLFKLKRINSKASPHWLDRV